MSTIRVVEGIAAFLLIVGLVGCLTAVRNAGSKKDDVAKRAQVWGSLFAGILTGAGVTVGVLVLQQWMADAKRGWGVASECAIGGVYPWVYRGLSIDGRGS